MRFDSESALLAAAPPEAMPTKTLNFAQRINRQRRERWREKKKREESELAAALDVAEAEEQVEAADSARATASLSAAEADADARRAALRGDSKQRGIGAFFRKGSVSSESLFVTPVKK